MEVGPDITPGTAGFLVTANDVVGLLPQLFDAVQVMFPDTVPADIVTLMKVVPCQNDSFEYVLY